MFISLAAKELVTLLVREKQLVVSSFSIPRSVHTHWTDMIMMMSTYCPIWRAGADKPEMLIA